RTVRGVPTGVVLRVDAHSSLPETREGRIPPSCVLSARAAADPGATAGRPSTAGAGASGPETRDAASAEEPDAAGLSRLPAGRAALAAAEELVQDGSHVGRLPLLDVAEQGPPAGPLV